MLNLNLNIPGVTGQPNAEREGPSKLNLTSWLLSLTENPEQVQDEAEFQAMMQELDLVQARASQLMEQARAGEGPLALLQSMGDVREPEDLRALGARLLADPQLRAEMNRLQAMNAGVDAVEAMAPPAEVDGPGAYPHTQQQTPANTRALIQNNVPTKA